MRCERWLTAKVIRVNPAARSCMIIISSIEYLPPRGTRGLGIRVLYGRRRVPLPPASITALIILLRSQVVEPSFVARKILRLREPCNCLLEIGRASCRERGCQYV